MNKVAVTGSCGFVGHWLVRGLKKKGYYVVGIDNLVAGDEKYSTESDEFIKEDVRNILPESLAEVKYIFHLAALPRVPYSWEKPFLTNETNIEGTLRILELAKKVGAKVVYSSSSSVYGLQKDFLFHEEMVPHPMSPYAVQKLAGEQYCEAYRMAGFVKTISLRYFNIFGEEQPADNPYTGVLTRFLGLKKKGEPLTIYGDGEQTRDFTWVGDIVRANIMAAESKAEGVFNIGTGSRYSINEVADMVGGGKRYLEPRVGEPKHTLAHIQRAQLFIGWEPTINIKEWISTQ